MRKCRLCGNEANEVVSSYTYHAWLCDDHVDTFISLATHWMYQMHKAVPWQPSVEEAVSFMSDDCNDSPENNSPAPTIKIAESKKQDYSNVLYNPEARGFARPRSKHLKVSPRWTGMETHDADKKHGEVVSRMPKTICDDSYDGSTPPTEFDYGSKAIIWDSSTVYTKS